MNFECFVAILSPVVNWKTRSNVWNIKCETSYWILSERFFSIKSISLTELKVVVFHEILLNFIQYPIINSMHFILLNKILWIIEHISTEWKVPFHLNSQLKKKHSIKIRFWKYHIEINQLVSKFIFYNKKKTIDSITLVNSIFVRRIRYIYIISKGTFPWFKNRTPMVA